MEPVKLGRTLGIGMRVASGILRDRASRIGQAKTAVSSAAAVESAPMTKPKAAAAAAVEPPPATAEISIQPPDSAPFRTPGPHREIAAPQATEVSRPARFGRIAGETLRASRQAPGSARVAVQGVKGFGKAFWVPFRHASGVLWLEITGMFFALFGLFFAQNVYDARAAWLKGPEHDHFLLYVALTVIFFWFSVSSFVKAHRRNKQQPGK